MFYLGTNTSMFTDRSLVSSSNKRRSKISLEKSEDESFDTHKSLDSLQHSHTIDSIKPKPTGLIYTLKRRQQQQQQQMQRELPTQTVTDACFIYRQQAVKQETNSNEQEAIIHRGREIAYEAANTPSIPSVMPNYTRDQIRELYGELDKQTRRLQHDEYQVHSSIVEKPHWKLASPKNSNHQTTSPCPLPKFRLEKSPETDADLLMAAYLSMGSDESQLKSIAPVDNFHTVMMNASAKVNEWAQHNEIYLSPVEKERAQTEYSSPLLMDIQMNLKKLTTTTTDHYDQPTTQHNIEQQTSPKSNESAFIRPAPRASLRQQHHQTIDTDSSSPHSGEIVFETTPSTPGSCGMYLEPYMRQGYDLPSSDSHIRDSSWKCDDKIESIDTHSPLLPPIASQTVDSDSLIDFDDGTNSYHTARDSRLDHTHHSIVSIESTETNSTIDQIVEQDELVNKRVSSDGSSYYDAASTSPTHTTVPNEYKSNDCHIEELVRIVRDIHGPHATDNLLFVYDKIEDESASSDEQSINQTPICVNNLLFIYDETITPTDDQPKVISNDSDEWSYDNLTNEQEEQEQVDTDNLGTIVHESLAARFQKPIHFNTTNEIIHEQDETNVETDNLETVVHEALAPQQQKPIQVKPVEEIFEEQQDDNESIFDTDNLGTIVHEALTARHQKPVQVKPVEEIFEEQHDDDESIFDTDNLGTIVHDALTARHQKPIHVKTNEEIPLIETDILDTIEPEMPIDQIETTVEFDHNCFPDQTLQFAEESPAETIEYDYPQEQIHESRSSSFDKSTTHSSDDVHTTETIVYEVDPSSYEHDNVFITESDPTLPVTNLSQIVSDSLLANSNFHRLQIDENNEQQINIIHETPMYDEEIFEEYGYRRTTTDPASEDVIEKFEELCHRYRSTFNQYENTKKKLDEDLEEFEKQFREQKIEEEISTPASDVTSEELITTIERIMDQPEEISTNQTEETYETVVVHRQPDVLGKYGFDIDEFESGRVKISSILDQDYCPNVNSGDEIISINSTNQTVETSEQCQSIFDSLWRNFDEQIEITVVKSADIPNVSDTEPISAQSSSLSWPISSTVKSGRLMKPRKKKSPVLFFLFALMSNVLLICGP